MTKKYGQNFLVDKGKREFLKDAVGTGPFDLIWEIGAGLGSLTVFLLEKCRQLTVFEIDNGLTLTLREFFGGYANFRIIQGDFLKIWRREYLGRKSPEVIIGNLPYNTAAVIIGELIETEISPIKMLFTLQTEVAERMAGNDISAISHLCAFEWNVRIIGRIPKESFFPRPSVSSSVVLFEKKRRPAIDKRTYFRFVNTIFRFRRKTLRNNLKDSTVIRSPEDPDLINVITAAGFDLERRAESFSTSEIVRILEVLGSRISFG